MKKNKVSIFSLTLTVKTVDLLRGMMYLFVIPYSRNCEDFVLFGDIFFTIQKDWAEKELGQKFGHFEYLCLNIFRSLHC